MGGVIWAKSPSRDGRPPVDLEQHIRDLLDVYRVLEQKGLIPSDIRDDLNKAIRFHDLGKVLPYFQIVVLGYSGYVPTDFSDNVPHALASLLFIPEKNLPLHKPEGKILASVVAYHHWRERYDDILRRRDHPLAQLARKLTRDPAFRDLLLQNLRREFKGLVVPAWNEVMSRYLAEGGTLYEVAPPPYRLYWEPVRQTLSDEHTRTWILLAGWLQRIDHFASFMEEEGGAIQPDDAFREGWSPEDVEARVQKALEGKASGSLDFWQKDALEPIQGKNARVVAPTGMGKTELGLLWAAYAGRQMIYALPLRVATEQIFTRVRGYVEANRTGLLHGDADLFLTEKAPETEALRVLEFSRHLAYPYLVATGDQFFPYVLRPPSYERIYAGFPHTALVVDEVQAYDPVAAAMVVKYAEDMVRMGGKVLVMTATLPGFVKKALEERMQRVGEKMEELNLFEASPYRERLARLKRHRVAFRVWNSKESTGGKGKGRKKTSRGLQDIAREVVEQAERGKKVLVVCNTVSQAREMFAVIREHVRGTVPVRLLHSAFARADRQKIEEEVEKAFGYDQREPFILVATQVVEASLDLDADVLFTEAAPLDALVQRMGRVFRRYRLQGEEIWNRAAGRPMEEGELPPNEPNVFVLVDREKLASGAGPVYDVDLVGMSLALLLDNEDTIHRMMKKKTRKAEVWAKELRKTLSSPDFGVVDLSEVDKYEKVSRLYELLEENEHRHIRAFHDTLAVLDAGYMSDRRQDAHRLFRRIQQVQGVPSHRLQDFEQAIWTFFSTESDHPQTYTEFKREVLSRFVVSAYPDRREEGRGDLTERIRSGLEQTLDAKTLRRLERWLAGLVVLPGRYDEQEGYVREKGGVHERRVHSGTEDRFL